SGDLLEPRVKPLVPEVYADDEPDQGGVRGREQPPGGLGLLDVERGSHRQHPLFSLTQGSDRERSPAPATRPCPKGTSGQSGSALLDRTGGGRMTREVGG